MSLVNKKAPEFSLQDQSGATHTLKQYLGKKVLLYFYPKDSTPGCTVEACNFRDSLEELSQKGVQVLGVSADSVKSHSKFADNQKLNFPILSDSEKTVSNAYGVYVEKTFMGKKYMGIQRDSFLINKEGVVVKHYEKVDPKTHTSEVLKDLEQF